jgi:hypothetical protein
LTDCVTKVVGEVAMKVCFALTVAFCIGCWKTKNPTLLFIFLTFFIFV